MTLHISTVLLRLPSHLIQTAKHREAAIKQLQGNLPLPVSSMQEAEILTAVVMGALRAALLTHFWV